MRKQQAKAAKAAAGKTETVVTPASRMATQVPATAAQKAQTHGQQNRQMDPASKPGYNTR